MAVNIIQHATDEPDWYETNEEGKVVPNETGAASLPLTLLTLDRARKELRIPVGATGQDDLIRNLIKSAVSFIAEDLNIPLVSEAVYVLLEHENLDQPITLTNPSDPFVLAASKVRYQLATAENYTVGDWPLEIEIGEENQIAPCSGDGDLIAGNIIVKPPGGKWPQAAMNHYALHYERGIKAASKDIGTFRQLAVLKMREAFFGTQYLKGRLENSAFGRIAESVRFYGALPNFNRIS